MVNVRQILSSVFVGAMTVNFAGSAIAEPSPAIKPLSETEFREYREETEAQIQKCIREKTATPKICRMMAYAAALAAGWPPDEAARVTDYRPEQKKPEER